MAIKACHKLSLALAGSTAAIALLAGAPVAHADDDVTFEEITVTASRRAERIQDIPYNISAVTGSTIERANMLDSAELLRSVSGVTVADRGPRNASAVNSIRIRGLNVDSSVLGDYAVSAAASVSTYLGDTPLFANLLLKDLARVEVLRGPQGTLYGSGALGGTVRYIPNKPDTAEFTGQVAGSMSKVKGSDSVGWTGDLTLNVPLSDKLAFRATGARQDFPGLTDYVNVYELDANGAPVAPNGILSPDASYKKVEDADTYDVWFGRAALMFKPSDTVEITASYMRQSDDIGGRRAETVGKDGFGNTYGRYEVGSVQLEPAEADVEMMALEASIDLGFATLTSSTSHYDVDGWSSSENTGFYAQAGWLGFYYNFARPMATAYRTYYDKAFVQEVRLVSEGSGPIQYVVGLYYQDQDRQSTQQSFLPGAFEYLDALYGPGITWANPNNQDFEYSLTENFKQKAVYGELTWALSENFDVTGGVRWFDNDSTSTSYMDLPFYVGLFTPLDGAPIEGGESKAIFKANATYHLSDDSLVYATFSQGYRRGGVNAVPTSGNFAEDPAWVVYEPDTVDNYELGFKGSADGLRYTASVFYVDWSNPQLNTSTPNWGFFAVANGDKASTKGVELELEGQIGTSLNYTVGYAFADAKLKDDFISPTGANYAPDGTRLPSSPKHMFNVALTHTHPVSETMTLISRVDGYMQSKVRNTIGTTSSLTRDIGGYGIWNGSVTLAMENIDISIWLKNAFNARGVSGVFTNAYMGTAPSEGYYGNGSKEQIALPRTFGLSATYRF
ncbi:TonB-dependent receptor [Pseudokordiimonas caeni]|uniref:TonB-dependent receptor n=1 Tax=Pseudokordiimonas caeni TaxID=2997908 RepID=UPI00281280CD|nr:TonB-dependent receptor [Pseudokordiimonas caeni]